MTKRFVSLPVVESSIYIFGGHQRTVPGGWSLLEQKHQVFELVLLKDGRQLRLRVFLLIRMDQEMS